MEEVIKNKGTVVCFLMILLAGCLYLMGTFLDLKVTAVNGVVASIGLCLMVASAFKEVEQ